MAKKKSGSKKNKKQQAAIPENALPVNIQLIGEKSDEDKKVYISQPVYKEIHRFTQNKTTNESGGVLVGDVIEEFGKKNVVISAFVEAKYSEGTPTTLKFTHETWEHIHKEIEKKHKGKKIVGWIHTHPDFGIFLSEYDKFIQSNFFNEDSQVAYVIDPIQDEEGFYCWVNGNIEKCKGFYLFDKIGAKLNTVEEKNGEVVVKKVGEGPFSFRNILLAVLTFVVFVLSFLVFSLSGEIKQLKSNLQTVVTSANQSISVIQYQLNSALAELDKINNELFPEEATSAEATQENQ